MFCMLRLWWWLLLPGPCMQVTARLLLDLREQLHPVHQPVKVSSKLSTRYNVAGSTAGHMWKVTLWSLYEAPAGESIGLVCG